MEEAFRAYADADAQQRSLTAEMDGKLVEIREDYADRLAELEAEKKAAFEKMQVFAVENREELFTKRKSMETTHGILGFRTGNPKLKSPQGDDVGGDSRTAQNQRQELRAHGRGGGKDKLLAERDLDECKVVMEACCIDVVQDETFFVEPKSEG